MTTLTHVCLSCATEFKYKKQYTEHNLCCVFLKDRSKERNTNMDLVDDRIPNDRMLYELVKNLALKCDRLEKEVEDLRRIARKEKKKIDILEYLKQHQTPKKNYQQWTKEIEVQPKYLEMVFENNIITGITKLVEDYISAFTNDQLPLAAFSHKAGQIYIYKEDWAPIHSETLNTLFDILSTRFLIAYSRWEADNPDLKHENEDTQKLKMQYKRKILGTYISDETKYKRFSTHVFDCLKQGIRTITEYEFS
jgi:hypothetical protein